MRFDSLLIGFLLLALFIGGGTWMIVDMNTNYASSGVNVTNSKFNGVYEKVDEIYDITEDAKDKTLEGEITESDTWETMTKGSYSAVRMVSATIPLFSNVTNTVASEIVVPEFIINIVYIAFMIIVIFAVIYMIFRYSPPKED